MTPGLEMLLRTKRSKKRHQTFSTRVVQRKWFSSSLFHSDYLQTGLEPIKFLNTRSVRVSHLIKLLRVSRRDLL